ncbi:MAG: hypothetical protein ACT4NY_13505 [Pseudonocardiales bacterium]
MATMPVTPKSLAQIAGRSGFSMSDVAFLAGIDESTVCRLWDDPDWLDRIKGKSLQALTGVLPGISEYVSAYPLASRRSLLADELIEVGLEINRAAYRQLVREKGVPEQYLCNVLNAAIQIVRPDARKAAAHLVRFWGREQDYALSFLFASISNNGLLVNLEPLMNASVRMVSELTLHTNSFHAIVAQATLMHHVAKATGRSSIDLAPSIVERRNSLTYRSAVIGLILNSNDPEVAAAYQRTVERSPLLSIVEDWAFPTYTHDAKLTVDFSLPRSLLLRHTADEILWEIDHYNDAYFYYLLETAIPSIIQRDQTFGLRAQDLSSKLLLRLETCEEPVIVKACEKFIDKLHVDPVECKGDILEKH